MLPTDHHSDNTNKSSPSSHLGGVDQGEMTQHLQEKRQAENHLRIKKIEVHEAKRHVEDLLRDILRLEGEIHHAEVDERRVNAEAHQLTQVIHKDTDMLKHAETGMHEVESEMRKKDDNIRKVEQEIHALQAQITEKERHIIEIKNDRREFVKQKEEFRREYELEHFTTSKENNHIHDVEGQVGRYKEEVRRKVGEKEHKQQLMAEAKSDVIRKEQELSQVESELARM